MVAVPRAAGAVGGADGGSVAGVEFFAVCEKEKRFIV